VKVSNYLDCRPSGRDWIGNIPDHWEVRRLKFHVNKVGSGVTPSGGAESYELEGIPLLRSQNIHFDGLRLDDVVFITAETHDSMANTKVRPKDVLLNITGASIGRCCVVPGGIEEANVNQHVAIVRSDSSIDPGFLAFLLRADPGQKQIELFQTGSGREGLTFEAIRNFVLPLPGINEQQQIAAFLDWKTGQIDALMARKKELLEKLKEKRLAVITQAVTRGLNPAAPLRDSGIPWLGHVPGHWEVIQLRRRWIIQDCKHKTVSFMNDGIPLVSIREVHDFEVNLEGAHKTTEEEFFELIEGDRQPQVGDIIYSRNASVGDAAIVTTSERFCMGQDVCLLRSPDSFPRFIAYLLRSYPLREQAEALMIGSTFSRINVGQIKTFWVGVPPFDEQTAIAEFLDEQTKRIDLLTSKVEAAIARLAEYRTALITAATTGKIDVRGIEVPAAA
jgi:type I restriction enzyme, S subunit